MRQVVHATRFAHGALVRHLCRIEDIDEISMFGDEQLDWLRRFLPFENGVAPAQTLRRALRVLGRKSSGDGFCGVMAIDGKTLRGSKHDKSGAGALHVVSAYAHEAGLVLAARAVETKGNEITANLNCSTCWLSRALS